MRKHKRWLLLTLLLLVGRAAWLIHRSLPPPTHNLLTRATKLADVPDFLSYNWLSSNELLVKRSTSVPNKMVIGQIYHLKPWTGYLDLIDTQTGTHTRLEKLAATIMQHNGHYSYNNGPWDFHRSPGGKWLLWIRKDLKDGGSYPVTARPDGSDYHEWNVVNPETSMIFAGRFLWVDDHRWTYESETNKQQYQIVQDVTPPYAERKLPYDSPEAKALRSLAEINEGYDWSKITLGADSSRYGAASTVFDILIRHPDSPPNTPPTKIDTIMFPPGTNIYGNLPNSQGTRIEFLVSDPNIPSYASLLHRLLPSYSYKSHPVKRLCIYRLDKKQLYEVGRVEETTTPDLDLINCMWLPDGKHIQFFYKNAIYIIPID